MNRSECQRECQGLQSNRSYFGEHAVLPYVLLVYRMECQNLFSDAAQGYDVRILVASACRDNRALSERNKREYSLRSCQRRNCPSLFTSKYPMFRSLVPRGYKPL